MKNEHIIYVYAPLGEDEALLIIGITDIGWEYLKKESGNFLRASPPDEKFSSVKEVLVVRGKDKNEIKEMLRQAVKLKGIKLTEYRE